MRSGPPFFSIFCTARNAAPFIARSLEAVITQDFDSWEIVFVDDASSDGTYAIAERCLLERGLRAACIRRPERVGKVQNFLDIAPRLNGEVFIEYDGDDWFSTPSALSVLHAAYAGPKVDATSGRAVLASNSTEPKMIAYPSCHRYAATTLTPVSPRTVRMSLVRRLLANHADLFIDPATSAPWLAWGDVVLSAPAMLFARSIALIDTPIYTINDLNPNRDCRLVTEPEFSRLARDTFAACIDLETRLQGPVDWRNHDDSIS